MFEVTVICSDCGEDSRQIVERIDDVDRAVCPCGYSYIVRSVAVYESIYSESRSLLTAKGPAVIEPDGGRIWLREGEKTREEATEATGAKAVAHR